MKFFGALLLVSAFAVACNGKRFLPYKAMEVYKVDDNRGLPELFDATPQNGGYPKITAIFADPRIYGGTFVSGRYDLNEQFSFNKNISLDAVIVPTRVKDASNNDSYVETYHILVEAADDLGDFGYREDVAVGYFNGTVEPGSSVVVPIRSMRNPEESLIAVPTRNGSVLRYVVYLQYGEMALASYPEFLNRSLEFLDIFSRTPQTFGAIVGLEYSLP